MKYSTAIVLLAALTSGAAHSENFELVTNFGTDTDVRGSNLPSFGPAINGDGTVIVFESAADFFGPGNVPSFHDVLVYDSTDDTLINLTLGGNNHGGQPDISSDGRYVVFLSSATNLLPDDADGALENYYIYDRDTELLETITSSPDGSFIRANTGVYQPTIRISGNGNYVLIGGSLLWERESGTFRNIRPGANTRANDNDISDDGTWVVFSAFNTDLTDDIVESASSNLFVYNTVDDTVALLPGTERATQPAISGDGRYVAFESRADGRPRSFGGSLNDIFLLDRVTGDRTLVTPNAEAESFFPALNTDGSQLVFRSNANNLLPNDNNGNWDIFVYTRETGALRQITAGSDGININPAIDATGDNIAFASAATNLLDVSEANGIIDMYVWRSDVSSGVEPTDPPQCDLFPSGVLRSTSGASIQLTGATVCPSSGFVSLGGTGPQGLRIPATQVRPELNLVPDNEGQQFDEQFVLYRYPLLDGTAVYVSDFVDRATGHPVSMSFRTNDLRDFELVELAVFSDSTRSRQRLLYVEHGSRWTFSSEELPSTAEVRGSFFNDGNRNGVDDEVLPLFLDATTVTLFFCGDRDGVVGSRTITPGNNQFSFTGLESRSYQLGVTLDNRFGFSSGGLDENGSVMGPIQSSQPPPNQRGFSNCEFFDAGSEPTLDIGVFFRN